MQQQDSVAPTGRPEGCVQKWWLSAGLSLKEKAAAGARSLLALKQHAADHIFGMRETLLQLYPQAPHQRI